MDKFTVIKEIKSFLEAEKSDLNYLVNIEANRNSNIAQCIIHEPGKEPELAEISYEPFLYVKDLKKLGMRLYAENRDVYKNKMIQYGIKFIKLKTANQKRLVDGYCYKVTSTKSFNAIIKFFREGGINPYLKKYDEDGNLIKNKRGFDEMIYRDLFYYVRDAEQFLISNGARLYKGFEDYDQIHKMTFDIETNGLRYQRSRVFAIGVKDNRGFEITLEVDKEEDDESEIKLIKMFFSLVNLKKPAILCGYNSEAFDFSFILGRMKVLKMDINQFVTTLDRSIPLKRKPNSSVKLGNSSERYTATEMWGISVIDILFAAKKTVAINSEMNNAQLKYVAAFEDIAKPNRTHINGEENKIYQYYKEDKIFVINELNDYIELPDEHQEVGKQLFNMQKKRKEIGEKKYNKVKKYLLSKYPEFVGWYRKNAIEKKMQFFINGKQIVRQYLLDDLWETEQVDNLYNQSSFMLAKMIPTTYSRITTMGTGAVWNLLLTAWSYENDLAIPYSDEEENFSGGLARCYKKGYAEDVIKIDYASLYPMEQLTWDIFPIFDITGVFKKLILYFTTTRNIYKKMANDDELNNEEVSLLEEIDKDSFSKFTSKTITKKDRGKFKVKQLPIKILNNSNFGALGSGPSFNWSDNRCAAQITCTSRLDLRKVISYFKNYGCVPLLAVTDGINFSLPKTTKIKITNDGVTDGAVDGTVDEMWQYNNKTGIAALIEKFNAEGFKGDYMSVDDDGQFISTYNLSRINYALLSEEKDKKTNEVVEKLKRTGNTIKSKTMPEYIEDFIVKGLNLLLHGKGKEFVEYYHHYAELIYYKQIPLKKIASKSKIKTTIKKYYARGNDKNGRKLSMKAHMELIIEERRKLALELFEKHKADFNLDEEAINKLTEKKKINLVSDYMPPEPPLDSYVYYVNTGYRKSHGDVNEITDKKTHEKRMASTLINKRDLLDNPDMKGEYNVDKYLGAFNTRVSSILIGFDEEIREKILCKIIRKKEKNEDGVKEEKIELTKEGFTRKELELNNFDSDDFDESMYLEPREVLFWNKSGLDPRNVWDGFNVPEDTPIYYDIYENALKYVNNKLKEKGRKLAKSLNDEINIGDTVLIKNGTDYSLAVYNGVFYDIKKSDLKIPKSDYDMEIEEQEKRIKLKKEKSEETPIAKKRKKYFEIFKKENEINVDLPMEEMFKVIENLEDAFNDFVEEQESVDKEEVSEYLGADHFE